MSTGSERHVYSRQTHSESFPVIANATGSHEMLFVILFLLETLNRNKESLGF